MHCSPEDTPEGGFRLGTIEEFLDAGGSAYDVIYTGHTIKLSSDDLPSETTIMVMKMTE
jgi:hypothetical protein